MTASAPRLFSLTDLLKQHGIKTIAPIPRPIPADDFLETKPLPVTSGGATICSEAHQMERVDTASSMTPDQSLDEVRVQIPPPRSFNPRGEQQADGAFEEGDAASAETTGEQPAAGAANAPLTQEEIRRRKWMMERGMR